MNQYQTELYQNLLDLCSKSEAFSFKDFILDDKTYRIFTYRLASYTDFLNPGALECRGTMYQVGGDVPVQLASLPMSKFFNWGENSLTENLNPSDIVDVMHKHDGSMISTYVHNGKLKVRTKGSLFSDQAIAAEKFIYQIENHDLYIFLGVMEAEGYTVNMEYLAPTNRVVIGYETEQLVILNVRHRDTGAVYFRGDPIFESLSFIDDEWVKSVPVENFNNVKTMTGVEGFVVRMKSGQMVKAKCDWYLALHHAKDSINIPRRLYEVVLEEGVDDLRSMFVDDPLAIKMIDEMQEKVNQLHNHLVNVVESYYNINKHLERKEYAIKGQEELDPRYFGLAMSLYVGKPVDYKGYLKRKWKEFGIKDEVVDNEIDI